ncbi:MAG: cyclopropane fatty acyl phospholipid synthase [Bdellovibrionales bacterium]|nr:cyclopropane fatty acyl phospholipid synthase [Bdellovibrionales bacterium]
MSESLAVESGQAQFGAGELVETSVLERSFPREILSVVRKEGLFQLGEEYIAGKRELGRIDELIDLLMRSRESQSAARQLRVMLYYLSDRFLNPQRGERAYNIGKVHYGLGNQLFERMLGESMTYTCGYFCKTNSLDQAQYDKLDLCCRKLKLERGMKVLDIGCGWGNFAKFAAAKYGVTVHGVTVSERQAEFARNACKGLPVEIHLQDYRDIRGTYDRIVSIEMIEAVGRKNLPTYFDVVWRSLNPGGLFLLEVISAETVSSRSNRYFDSYLMWILKHIFPDGYLPTVTELAEPCRQRFQLEDWHSFGPDYDRTLMAWHENFERAWDELHVDYGEKFRRIWKYYLLGCAGLFRSRTTHLYQILYSKGFGGRYGVER